MSESENLGMIGQIRNHLVYYLVPPGPRLHVVRIPPIMPCLTINNHPPRASLRERREDMDFSSSLVNIRREDRFPSGTRSPSPGTREGSSVGGGA